jgi:hypothetical protein
MGNAKNIKHMLIFSKILMKNFFEALNYPANKSMTKVVRFHDREDNFCFVSRDIIVIH